MSRNIEWVMNKMDRTPIDLLIYEQGLKKTFVAKQARINNGTLSRIVSGESEPTLRVALRLAKFLGKTVEELWGHLEN